MFELTEHSINYPFILELRQRFDNPANGAAVTFEGIVRNHNDGLTVSSLEYQAYPAMALKIGDKIITAAKKRFDITEVFCVHRTGHLQIGDMAVWVIATAHHRQAAFLACEFVMNEVKREVPIWKREHYLDREPVWVACNRCGLQEEVVATHHCHN